MLNRLNSVCIPCGMHQSKSPVRFHELGFVLWQGRKDSNPRMPESKSGALTNLATPLERSRDYAVTFCRQKRKIKKFACKTHKHTLFSSLLVCFRHELHTF